ncbi:uncharacterized protein LOC125187344 [Salvia hispanica]|uniref:uncharacterized protein LOC125187344 n=1 Tax=Salvia hispanica TaxID=49212 RepID=UPI00200942BE|nr:uncharacterized protein LOC125187344 [Salvia hispanica]
MKKLYKKSTVHPTPSVVSEHLLSFLPAAILALTAALSPAEREVLAYLISRRKSTPAPGDDHAACFNCNCFRCYMSYWAKWDSSPNRQLIHEAIDAFEEKESRKDKTKKERRKGKSVKLPILNEPTHSEPTLTDVDFCFVDSHTAVESGGGGGEQEEEEEEIVITEEEFDKGSVRR